MRKLVPLFTLLALAACAKKSADMAGPESAPPPAATANAPPGAGDTASSGPSRKPATEPAAAPMISASQLAYVFDYTFALPKDRIGGALDHDQDACVGAGPTVCQLVGSSLDRASEGVASARLEVRATESWIARFRAGADAEAKAAGGHIDGAQVQSEDLSRSIVDTQAAVRAKTALRDRLQQLLAERPGKLSDVMDVQHELTQAQADLDATTSELAVMRTRVAMSKLTIAYNAEGAGAPNGPWRPLRQAAHGFVGNAVGVLAALVSVFSVLLPLGLVIGPLIWLAVWFAGRGKRRQPSRPVTPGA